MKANTWYSRNRTKVLARSRTRYETFKLEINKQRKQKYDTNEQFRKSKQTQQALYRRANATKIKITQQEFSKRPAYRFRLAKQGAKRRNIDFTLTFEEFSNLITEKCIYCGSATLCTTGSGLDRKNSQLGYTSENVVPCCTICNTVKNSYFTYEEMLILGKVVAEINAKRNEQRTIQN